MRAAIVLLLVAASPVPAVLADAGGAAAPPAPTGPTAPGTATAPARPAQARPATPARPATGRVWTMKDLESLRQQPSSTINYLEVPVRTDAITPNPTGPVGVASRYQELLAQADAELEKLRREQLAGTNPLLRGMAGERVRPVAEIQADRRKWEERRLAAQRGLDALEGAGAPR